jgi:molybdopterin molybdotransferase
LRGRLQDGFFNPIGRQESHALFGLSRANALLRVDRGETLDAGAMVLVEIWD